MFDEAHLFASRANASINTPGARIATRPLVENAIKHGGRLATFDQAIPLSAVPGATADHLAIL